MVSQKTGGLFRLALKLMQLESDCSLYVGAFIVHYLVKLTWIGIFFPLRTSSA